MSEWGTGNEYDYTAVFISFVLICAGLFIIGGLLEIVFNHLSNASWLC